MQQDVMRFISVQITAFVDDHPPGFVACSLIDAEGRLHRFVEKAPVVSREDLGADSVYPRSGEIACEVRAGWTDDGGRALVRVSTGSPWGIESSEGVQEFVLRSSQVT